MKGLKQHIIDFEIIETNNPKTLVFIDSSNYYTDPESPLLEITLPGYNKYFLVHVEPRKVNTFNSGTIGLTEIFTNGGFVDLPDGIYNFRYKICPYEFLFKDKSFFRTTLIENKLAEVYNKLEITDCNKTNDGKIMRDIVEIHTLIEGAKAIVCKNEKKANTFYQLALKLVDKILNQLCKDCK